MRKIAVEERHDRESAALHVPGPVFELRIHQERDATPVDWAVHLESAGFLELD